jgi:long-chain fatty acid transport protein
VKRNIIYVAFLGLVFFAGAQVTQGSGFLIYEHGAAAMAMGGAFVGVADDPTAIFHNPAGIAWLEDTQFSLGTTLIIPSASLSLPNWPDPAFQEVDAESKVFFPSTFYITHEFNDMVTAGFGFFSPYGLGLEWPKEYPLKYISTKSDMKTFFLNPCVALKFTEDLSFGFGISYILATLNFAQVQRRDFSDIGLGVYDVPATLDASGSALGLNAGVLYRGENYTLGFNWRGGFEIEFDGDIDLDPSELPPALAAVFPKSGAANTAFSFPHIMGIGASFNLTDALMLSADIHYVMWSSYDEFVVRIEIPGIADLLVEEKWDDSFIIRGGLQYLWRENFALRAGIVYDQTPQPEETIDPILPDADRWAFTGGFGYTSGNFVIDVAYQLELFKERRSPNRDILVHPLSGVNLGEGIYDTTAHLISVSLGYKF